MEGKVVMRTAILMTMLANLVFASSNNPVDSIKMSYKECYVNCASGCFSLRIIPGCLISCQKSCHRCDPSCKTQDSSSSSLTSFCNVGCSLAKCSEITDSEQWKSCLGDCSENYCKL